MEITTEELNTLERLSKQESLSPDEMAEYERISGLTSQPDAEPQPAPQQDEGFSGPMGRAMTEIPAGIADIITRGDSTLFGRGMLDANTAMASPSFRRTAPPMVASMIFPPANFAKAGPVVSQFVSSAIQALSGYTGSRLAGDSNGEQAENALISSFPMMGKVKGQKYMWRGMLKGALQDVVSLTTYTAAADTTRKLVDEGKLSTYDTFSDAFSDLVIPAAFGVVTGSFRGVSGNINSTASKMVEARKEIGSFLGEESVTLGVMDPERWAATEARIAKENPKLGAKIAKLGSDITERYQNLFGDIKHSTEIADELNKYAGRINNEEQTLARFTETNNQAKKALIAAEQAGLGPDDILKIEKEVMASEMAIINQRAATKYWRNLADESAGGIIPISESQDEFVGEVRNIFDARSKAANIAYKESGVSLVDDFIPISSLEESASFALRNRKGPQADAIMARIKAADNGTGFITINEMRELRQGFADQFTGGNDSQMSAFEDLANDAYRAITAGVDEVVRGKYGEEVATKFRNVNGWWARTANAKESRYVRQMISNEPGKNTLETLAADVVGGKLQSTERFLKFVDAVAEQSPDVAKIGRAALMKAIRQGFIRNASKGQDFIDFEKLTTSLNAAAFNKGFPIQDLGFGSKEQLKQVAAAYKRYSNGQNVIPNEAMVEFYKNPLVRDQLAKGADVSELANEAAARNAFIQDVRSKQLQALSGAKANYSQTAIMKSKQLAKEAGMDLQAQQKIVEDLQKDPLMRAFASDSIGMPVKFAAGDKAVYNTLRAMTPGDADGVMRAMRQTRPDLAKRVSNLIASDVLGELLVKDSTSVGKLWTVNMDDFQRIFDPKIAGRENNIGNLLRTVMTKDELSQFKRTIPAFRRLSEYARTNGSVPLSTDAATALGVSSAVALGRVGASGGLVALWRKIGEFAENRRYNLLTKLATDKEFSKLYFNTGGRLEDMIRQAKTPRIMFILKNDQDLSSEIAEAKDGK
jgi:hypothetical protein